MAIQLTELGKTFGNNAKKYSVPLAVIFALCGGVSSCYSSNQHDRRVWADFRGEVIENPGERIIKIETDGVIREGYLNKGAAFKGGVAIDPSTFIVAASPQAQCWYSSLRVTAGSDNLPLWEKVFGGNLSETYFMNSAFEGNNCLPTSGTISQTNPQP